MHLTSAPIPRHHIPSEHSNNWQETSPPLSSRDRTVPVFSLHLLRSESFLLRGEPKVCLLIYAVPSSEDEGITEGTLSTAETNPPAWLMGLGEYSGISWATQPGCLLFPPSMSLENMVCFASY